MKKFLSGFALLTLLLTPAVYAAEFKAAEELTLTDTLSENSYLAGGRVRIDNTVNGDLIIVGGDVKVNSTVSQDLAIAGGDIDVGGFVKDDLRVVGGKISITGTINGDLLVAGGEVVIEQTARILGDVVVAAGEVSIFAPINGNLRVHAGSVRLLSSIAGGAFVYAEDVALDGNISGGAKIVARNLSFKDGSRINGDLEYFLPDGEIDIDTIVSGTVTFNDSLGMSSGEEVIMAGGIASIVVALVAALSMYKLLSALLVIVLLVLAKKTYFPNAAEDCRDNPWLCLLTSILFIITTPFIILAFMVTIIGIPVGLSIIPLYIIALFFADTLAAVTFAQMYAIHKNKKWSSLGLIGASLLVYAGLHILMVIPIIGWIGAKGLVLLAFGACLRTEYKIFMKVR